LGAIGPMRAGVAIHVVCAVAREMAQAGKGLSANPAVHGALSPDNVTLGYDGSITLVDADAPSRRADAQSASRAKPAYLAPEQVSGGDVDRRADVFSLGVVLWELLTGTTLFLRDTASETRIAIVDDPILDVRDVNPDVPAILAEVLATALQRDRNARFDTPEAFCKALAGAASSSGTAEATRHELAAWVAERVPKRRSAPPRPNVLRPANPSAVAAAPAPAAALADVPDLDVPGASRSSRSRPTMDAVKARRVPDLGSGSIGDIPEFDTSAMAAEALAPSTRPPAMSASPVSGRGSSPSLSGPVPEAPGLAPSVRGSLPSAPAQQAGGGRSISFDGSDDDDFDMEIERNVASTTMPTAQRSRSAGGPASGGHRASSGGLELAAPSRMAREASSRTEERREPALGSKAAGLALSIIVGGGTAFALWKYMHHAGGFDVTRALPHAFDGTSATESGAISLVSLVVAVIVGFVGLRFKPHAWAVVAAGGTILLIALAMVTVTLASTGENPTPPDGALLVPYLFPAAVLMLALGVKGRAARLFAAGHGARRLASVPLAAIAGAIAFLAFEASRFAR
jgi:serine/threonine protein kinase